MTPQTDAFNAVDELKASLRLMSTILEEESNKINRLTLWARLSDQGVTQNQMYTAIKTLIQIGLIEETLSKKGKKRITYTNLTPKGRQVAQLAQKIKQTLT